MNKMLISATQSDEVRVALVKEKILYDLDVERPGFEQKKANIYKAKVSRIEPSLEAAFVDYGADRHGFLPFKEIARSFFKPELANEPFSRLSIKDALKEGQEIMVQIDKEERGTKGAALTTFISMAGSYLVLMPNNPRVGGVSRRVEGKERDDLRDLLRNLNLPEGMGLIVRTAGVGRSQNELKWDLESLVHRWQAIEKTSTTEQAAPFLIYQEGDAVMRAIRDYLRQDIEEILVDNQELFEKTKEYIEQVKPAFIDKIKLYQDKVPLFSSYQIENQIETAYQRVVRLPSGGSISIDHTEALIAVDVNSAKATSGGDIETTAFNTNVEAAEEVARQLRLRDIGGLIVIDFIDMSQIKHQREVSRKLKDALEYDRARVQVGHITRFGLLEMSRQRLRSHLGEAIQVSCPRCDGQGTIRSIESLASTIIRIIEEEASKGDSSEIQIQLPLDLATFILNEKRKTVTEISDRQGVEITVLPNHHLETPKYKVKRIRTNDRSKNKEASYKIVDTPELETPTKEKTQKPSTEKPAVNASGKLVNEEGKKPGLLKRLFGGLFKKSEASKTKPQTTTRTSSGSRTSTRSSSSNRGRPQSRNPRRGRKPGGQGDRRQSSRRSTGQRTSDRRPQNTRGRKPTPPPSNTYPEMTSERIKDDSKANDTPKQEASNTPTTSIMDNRQFNTQKTPSAQQTAQPAAPKTSETDKN